MNKPIENQTNPAVNERLIDLIVFIVFLLLYSITLQHGVTGIESPGDSAKFQYIGSILGVPHSPGYPLYVIINWFWSHIPLQISLATKINLLSAFFAAGTLTFFRRTLTYLKVTRTVSLIATAGLALSRLFWMRSTEAGPGAMSYFLISLLLFFLIRWSVNKQRFDLWGSLIITFITAWHTPLCLWLTPLTIIYIISVEPAAWKKSSTWFACSAGLAIGLGVYSYIYIRSHQGAPILEYVRQNTSVKRVFLMSLNVQFWGNYFLANPKIIFIYRFPQLITETCNQLTYAGAFLSIIGIMYLFLKKIRIAVFFTIALIAAFLFKAHIYSINLTGEYWLFFMFTAYLAGVGLQWVWNYKKKAGIVLSIIYATLILFSTAKYNRDLLVRQNELDIETLLLICPKSSNLLADDYYTWREILRYYNFTNPFVKKRVIKLQDKLDLYDGSTNFFISDTIKKQLDEANISYVPISSNDTAVLYIIGKLE